ncbi:hypothetical protein [Streptomyces aurantiogriseus]|uniref:Transposase n=1 Tax=Streptomyces aurantiogriseus TaxID=66870 RepID=A0A918C4H7_9ACTN|nr:hypothetical protein [Streptomyces aurantiogriseus]GGR06768.1 hypothetical protein GCM10010251_23180 [Streptomyces aurantiogriseus]
MTQLDLFGEKQAAMDRSSTRKAERDARAARHSAYRKSLKIDCCTGEPILPDEHGIQRYRCGRCGALAFAGTFHFTHDCGWAGCYADTEPTRGTARPASRPTATTTNTTPAAPAPAAATHAASTRASRPPRPKTPAATSTAAAAATSLRFPLTPRPSPSKLHRRDGDPSQLQAGTP